MYHRNRGYLKYGIIKVKKVHNLSKCCQIFNDMGTWQVMAGIPENGFGRTGTDVKLIKQLKDE